MLVLVILGLLAVTVSLTLPDSAQQRLETDARRLRAQIALAMEQAIYRSRDHGLWIGERGYRFHLRRGGRWEPLEADSRLAPYALDGGTSLRLSVAGQALRLDGKSGAPQILFASDGQVSEFELTLVHPDARGPQRILASFAGDLRLLEPERP